MCTNIIHTKPKRALNKNTCEYAAYVGDLELLQRLLLYDSTCSTSIAVCSMAARHGHLHILQWLCTQDPPCPWDKSTTFNAAANNHLEVLQWLRSCDPPCPWDSSHIVNNANERKKIPILLWMICCERTELPYHIPDACNYNMLRHIHLLFVIEILEDIHNCITINGDIIPKDVVGLIGSYVDVQLLLFDKEDVSHINGRIAYYVKHLLSS